MYDLIYRSLIATTITLQHIKKNARINTQNNSNNIITVNTNIVKYFGYDNIIKVNSDCMKRSKSLFHLRYCVIVHYIHPVWGVNIITPGPKPHSPGKLFSVKYKWCVGVIGCFSLSMTF